MTKHGTWEKTIFRAMTSSFIRLSVLEEERPQNSTILWEKAGWTSAQAYRMT